MYGVDSTQGIFLMEQLDLDEYGASTGTPLLPFYLPATLSAASFQGNAINAILKTRNYSFGTIGEKRFSTAEVDMVSDAGSQITTSAVVTNPDATTTVDTFGFATTEDSTRRNPIRKLGTSIQLIFTSFNLRPSIRSAYVYAVQKLKTNQSRK